MIHSAALQFKMSLLQQARLTIPEAESSGVVEIPPEIVESRQQRGAMFRQFLASKFCHGAWFGHDVCAVADLATASGATGVEDLVLRPPYKKAHQHLEMVLDTTLGSPDLITVDTPLYDKRNSFRSLTPIPYRPAFMTLAKIFESGDDVPNDPPQL